MEEKLEIKILANFDGKGSKEAKEAVENIGKAAKASETGIKNLANSIRLIKINAFFELAQKGFSALAKTISVFSDGINLNSQFEAMNTKLQSLIFTADKSANIDPFAKWVNSGKIAESVIDELKGLAVKTGFSQLDLGEMFGGFFSTASSHLNMDQAIAVFEKLAYTAKVSGADIGTLKATLDNVGAGIVQTNNDFGRFLAGLGLGTEELKKAIADGSYAELLINSLKPFETASQMAGKSFKQIAQEFRSNIDDIKRIVAEPIFNALSEQLDNLNKGENLQEIQNALSGLGEEFGRLIKENLTPENVRALGTSISALVGSLTLLVQAFEKAGDILAPDRFFGENAGWAELFTTFNKGLLEIKDFLFDWDPFDEKDAFSERIKQMSQSADEELKNLGAVFENFELKGFDGEIDMGGLDKAVNAVRKKYNELVKIEKEISELTAFNKLAVKADDEFMQNLKKETNETYDLLMRLQNYSGIEAFTEDINKAKELNERTKALADETARLKQEEQNRLGAYLKANETRFKNYEKTINSLITQEEKLTKSLEDGVKQREAIQKSFNDKRADISQDYDEKIRGANQYNVSDSTKYALDMQRYNQAIQEAKKALSETDVSGYERALSLAKQISEAWANKSGKELKENEFDIVGIELYKQRLGELKDLELSGSDLKEQKELEAHDAKMSAIEAELKAVQDKIAAEKAFYDEYTLKAKELQDLLNTNTNSEHNINLNDTEAKAKIKELQKNTSSTHTVYVKEVRQSVEKKATGGLISGIFRRRRGKIKGHDLMGSDDVPALLTRGEFVQNVRAVDYYGTAFMEALNRRKIPREALPKLSSASLRSARNSPTGRFASFATGGLVLNKLDTNFIKQLTDSNQDVQELAKRLRQAFNNQAGGENASVLKKLAVAKQWEKMYPEHIKTNSRGYSFDFVGLAKAMIANSINGSALQNGELKAFSTGGMVAKNSTTRNVNLNLNFGGKNSFAMQSDEATAAALERYLKGIGLG